MEEKFMELALSYAQRSKGDVPVGAVIVKEGKVIGYGYNQKEKRQDATCHAELLAIRRASKKVKNFILEGSDLYVTLEPCMMCYGAIASARISNVYFGAYNKKYPTVEHCQSLPFNHKPNYFGGIKEQECSALIQTFFVTLREKHACNKDRNKNKTNRI